jgi:hypothetical protein
VLIWTSGIDKKCTWFNRQWLEFVGRPMEREIGGWMDRERASGRLQRCLQTTAARLMRGSFLDGIPASAGGR